MLNIRHKFSFFPLLFLLIFSSCIQKQKDFKIISQKQIVLNSQIEEDSSILQIIEPYKDSLNKVMNQVIGYSDEILSSFKPESPLTNFVSDLLLEYGKLFLESKEVINYPIISIVNSKGLRTPISAGEVTVRNIYELMPFENYLVTLKLNGEQIQELFNHIVSEGGDGLSGATFIIRDKKAENIFINQKPLKIDEYYWVIAPDYLAQGGDHYTILTEASEIIESNYKLRELIIKKINALTEENKNIVAPKNQRIKTH